MSRESFFNALKKHIAVMRTSSLVQDPMIFGQKKIKKENYIFALESILTHEFDWLEWVEKNFDFYEVYGRDDWSEVMVTGYYEPRVLGAKKKSLTFSQPLYMTPTDLVTVDLKKFGEKFSLIPNLSPITGRIENQKIVPYYSRKEIDEDQKLVGKKLELVWVDPIDAFFIQIQGSGLVELSSGELVHVGYDAQNGHSYMAIGKFLTGAIPLENMSMQKIRAYLKTLSAKEQQQILNKNPSYVFFKKLETAALTYTGMEVQDGRTIATDKHFFPKGALAFLDVEIPVFNSSDDSEAQSWQRQPRLVFDQDTGGAIRGGGRVDLYFGSGDEAAQQAGVMKHPGKLYYLVPKNL